MADLVMEIIMRHDTNHRLVVVEGYDTIVLRCSLCEVDVVHADVLPLPTEGHLAALGAVEEQT